jgi:flagellar protein FlbD
MIKVTRFDQSELIINAELIEFVEQTPDTVLTMTTGRKVLVRETADEIVQRVIAYRQAAESKGVEHREQEKIELAATDRRPGSNSN